MNKYDTAEDLQDPMVERIMTSLPNVFDLERRPRKDRIDFNFRSGDTLTCLESKYRKGHKHTDKVFKDNARIQWAKYKALKEAQGWLLQIFEDSWWLWYIGDTKPCETGLWTHNKSTVEASLVTTDLYAAFDYKDAKYHCIK